MKQMELKAAIGASVKSIKNWENPEKDSRPRPENIARLAAVLRVPVAWLAENKGEPGFDDVKDEMLRRNKAQKAQQYSDLQQEIRERLAGRSGDQVADSLDAVAEAKEILKGIDDAYRRQVALVGRIAEFATKWQRRT